MDLVVSCSRERIFSRTVSLRTCSRERVPANGFPANAARANGGFQYWLCRVVMWLRCTAFFRGQMCCISSLPLQANTPTNIPRTSREHPTNIFRMLRFCCGCRCYCRFCCGFCCCCCGGGCCCGCCFCCRLDERCKTNGQGRRRCGSTKGALNNSKRRRSCRNVELSL